MAAAVLIAAAVFAGNALSDAVAPTRVTTGTGASVGRAAFSYLEGLRAFAAYALWNRLEPQLHEYYEGSDLKDDLFAVPTMTIVMALKPDFVPPYYVMPWVLIRNGRLDQGLAIAKAGVANNPRSGLLIMAYAQILTLEKNDYASASQQCDAAMRADTYWADDEERFFSLRIAEDVYLHLGETAKAKAVAAVLESIKKAGVTPGPDALGQSHDHNGDGVPDH